MKTKKANTEFFELKIQGSINGEVISKSNFDISDIIDLLDDTVCLVRKPLNKDLIKEKIALDYEDGCIRLLIASSIVVINSLFADINEANNSGSLFNIDKNRAFIINKWQQKAKTENSFVFTINDSDKNCKFRIDKNTEYLLPQQKFIDAEVVLYGEITDMGGKNKPNIHIDTEYGTMTIACKRDNIKDENRLYTICGIRALAKQDFSTYEVSKEDLQFIEFIEYKGKLEGEKLLKFIKDGTEAWQNVDDSVKWQRNIRGYDD